jgi:signal transduction histidine kinase
MLLSIRDRGRGMEPAEIQQIGAYIQFQRTLFEQQGIGLGLAIVRRLVELNGGVMEIDTRPGEGTEIRVQLPLV